MLVVSEYCKPFVVAPEFKDNPPWAEMQGVDFQNFPVCNTLILDPLDATKEIVRRHKEAGIAAPAAEWCLDYSYGRIGKGRWALPTSIQLRAIYRYKYDIWTCRYVLYPQDSKEFELCRLWSCEGIGQEFAMVGLVMSDPINGVRIVHRCPFFSTKVFPVASLEKNI